MITNKKIPFKLSFSFKLIHRWISLHDNFSAWVCLWQFSSLKWCDTVECRQLSFPPLAKVTQFALLWVCSLESECTAVRVRITTDGQEPSSPMVTPTATLHTHTAWTESTQISVTAWRVFVQKTFCFYSKPADFGGMRHPLTCLRCRNEPFYQMFVQLCDLWNLY